ncbi:MAG: LysM peptidoglycan-binding domain-containing protein [Candidatus Promineifilaceae bacterium]
MANTRGNLVAARIFEVDDGGNEVGNGVECMFNPYEYTVSKSNTYQETSQNRASTPEVEFTKAGPQTLKLKLTFDTYETGEDVSQITNKLWKFMEPKEEGRENEKSPPPQVAFEWGVFRFIAVITSMTQKFTLFKNDGTPVRASVDVTFTQHKDVNDYPNQNPTSGGGPVQRTWSVVRGDRLDAIATAVYGDAAKWRLIADYNQLDNPLALKPGTQLTIPEG